MPMDLFEPRTMLEAVEQMKLARRFLGNTFFGAPPVNFVTKNVDIDIYKGQRKMAPFVRPNRPGVVVDRTGASMRSYQPAYIKPKMETNAGQLMNYRSPGEHIYSGRTPLQRAGEQLARDMEDLDDQINRREEWMIAQALTTGQVNVVGEGIDDVVDFQMDDSHIITEGTAWTDPAGTPIANLRKYKRLIAKDSGRTGSTAVLSVEAADALIDSEDTQKKMDTRRIDLGMIQPDQLPDGVTYLGYLRDPGMDLFVYEEWYIDAAGDEQPMIPAGGVIVGPTSSRCTMLYGAIQDMEAIEGGMFDVSRYPKSWVTKDPSVRWLMMQAAPLPGFHEPDAFVFATVA
ncbi:major capsid protein [Vreelandella neptunia]|uniref:Major capsid protein n=1 Tax=Vreelandella neptunia TaxID=115551 RepID=A0ABZ0YTQ9_9GAMM|nr:major capsid protein [Halomonas neptunia]MDN3561714.1 major capsid protein [Halomonas neptunia]WQH14615.1 major capsid protein [Halomonas neptunia]